MRVATAIFAAAILICIGSIPAHASTLGFELNGTYSFLSNGEWAKSNDVFRDEPVVRSTWQISSSCTGPSTCTGQISSDQGWTIPLKFSVDRWIASREIPNWAPCDTGGAVTGHQRFTFYGTNDQGQNIKSTDLLAGTDITRTDSGSCGKNLPLDIVIPMRLEQLT
ncbi:hypothetical protein BH09ACT8_BH09ACT8_62440 [soil metagenome]